MTHDPARHTRRELHRKERRARKQADRIDTSTIAAAVKAIGAGDLDDWLDDDQPAARVQRGTDG